MNRKAKTTLTIVISVILAVVLIGASLAGIDFEKTVASLQKANYLWVALSVFLGIIAYWLRSQRWRLLLEPMGFHVTAKHAFIAVCMNYFWNLLIPRSGEVARSTSLYTLDKTPIDKSLGTVISERVIDFICLTTIALIAFLLNFDLAKKLLSEVWQGRQQTSGNEPNYLLFYLLFGAVLLSFILLFLFRKRIKNTPFFPKIRNFVYGLSQGLKTVFQLKRKGLFIFYTFLIWLFYYLMTYLVVFALPETAHLNISQGFFLLLVGGIGMVIPASGGIGAYHAAMRLGLVLLGLSGETGLSFAFLVHTPHTLIALFLGVLSFILSFLDKRAHRPESK